MLPSFPRGAMYGTRLNLPERNHAVADPDDVHHRLADVLHLAGRGHDRVRPLHRRGRRGLARRLPGEDPRPRLQLREADGCHGRQDHGHGDRDGTRLEEGDLPSVLASSRCAASSWCAQGCAWSAATKGVVVSADSGGKTKTVTLLVALGFFLGAPMLQFDGASFFHWDASAARRLRHEDRRLHLRCGFAPFRLVRLPLSSAAERAWLVFADRWTFPVKFEQPNWPRQLPPTTVLNVPATLGPIGERLPAPGTWGSAAGVLFFFVCASQLGLIPSSSSSARRWPALRSASAGVRRSRS